MYRPRNEKSAEDIVREILSNEDWTWFTEASIQILTNAVNASTDAPTTESVRAIIAKEKQSGRLARSKAYTQPLADFFQAHPEIRNTQADVAKLERLIIHHKLTWDVESMEYVSGMPDANIARTDAYNQQQQAEQAQREAEAKDQQDTIDLRNEMLSWFESSQKRLYAANQYEWQRILKVEAKRLADKDVNALRAEYATRLEKRRLHGMTSAEIRSENAAKFAQPKQEQKSAPLTYTTRDGITFELTWKSLIDCSKRNPTLFREITRVKGADFVNNILALRPQA